MPTVGERGQEKRRLEDVSKDLVDGPAAEHSRVLALNLDPVRVTW